MNEIKSAFSKYATFAGRASRKEYWIFYLASQILIVAPYSFLERLNVTEGNMTGIIGVFMLLLTLALIIPLISVQVRRLHDINKSGWYIFIVFIPIIGAIWLFILDITAGDMGENMYGPSPYANADMLNNADTA